MKVRSIVAKGLAALCVVGGLATAASGQDAVGRPEVPAVSLEAPVAVLPPARAGMSLDDVVATVLKSDPRLRVGNEEINQAVAEAITASLRPNPTLGVDGQLLPLRRLTPEQQGGPPQFDAAVAYPIDWFLFGKRKASMASTAIGIRQTESEYYNLIRQRVRDASLVYYEIVELKALRDLARQDVENFLQVEAATARAVANGGRPDVDLKRIRLDLVRSQQLLRDAEMALNNSKARLRVYLGRNDSNQDFEVIGSLDMPAAQPTVSLDEAVAIAQESRPDLAALRFKVAKAEADAVVEHRKAYPGVVAKGGYSRQFQQSIGFPDVDTVMVGVEVGLPIFDRNQGNRTKAASAIAQSQYEMQARQVELRAEIEQALNEYRFAELGAQAVANEQLKLAEQVRDSINKANIAGGRPLLDVLDAQRNYRDTYRSYITNRANFWRASVRLNATLGKKLVP